MTMDVGKVLLSQDVLEGLAVGHGAPPRRQGGRMDFLLEAKQVVKTIGQIAKGHDVARRLWVSDAAGVFAHAHIAHAVGAIFYGLPVADDGIKHVCVGQLVLGSAAHIVGDFGDGKLLGFW